LGDNMEIFVINSDGTGLTQLTDSPEADLNPSISGDGSKVAFHHYYDISVEKPEIFVVNSDGTGLKQLTSNFGDRYPSISGDGSKIAFQRGYDNDTEIFVVNSDGTGLTQLTNNNVEDEYPSIDHTGERVVFEVNDDIYLVNYDADSVITEPTLTPSSQPTPEPEPFSTTIIVASVISATAIGVGLLFYFKKRKH
jgi:Tol biopolymer transport system component